MRRGALLAALALATATTAPAEPPTATEPAWEARTVTPSATEVKAQTYVVKPGDSLSRVAERTGASVDAIAHANDLAAPFVVRPGQKLAVPAGRYHRVGKGESGIAIARAYGVDWSQVASLNHLEPPYILREGQRLLLPSVKDVAKMTLEQRAAAFSMDIDDLVTGSEPALGQKAKPARPTPSPNRTLAPTTPVAAPQGRFSGRFSWPLHGKILRPFGPMRNGGRMDGIAIAASEGSPIHAAAEGVVAWAGSYPAFGNVILLRHAGGWVTIYGNAEKLVVERGQAVKRGQEIARAGDTGQVSQPQLYFEVLQARKPVDPMTVLDGRN